MKGCNRLSARFSLSQRNAPVSAAFFLRSGLWSLFLLVFSNAVLAQPARSDGSPAPRAAALPPNPGYDNDGRKLAKFEPAHGCYIGAFIELDYNVEGDIGKFEDLTKKKHASYFTYVGYGRPFPKEWVDKVKAAGAVPQIAFEPNDGLDEVQDDAYLRAWAKDAARSQVPIFLRWASEMNGPWCAWHKDPQEYIDKFRLVAQVMREEAPNVAMVWTPFAEPQRLIAQYYPGDEWVDWIGMNIYSVYVNDGDPNRPAYDKDPVEALRFLNDTFPNKPIHISEFAATIYCKGTQQDTVDFAIQKMTRFYTAIRDEFPRVKAVNWFCWDTIRGKKANNNYSFLSDGRALLAYRNLVSDPYFLSKVTYDPNKFRRTVTGPTTIGPKGQFYRPGVPLDRAVEDSGAVLVGLTEPALRGLNDGDIIKGDLSLRAQLPLDMEAKGLIWQVDGRTVALTNTKPYRVYIPFEKIGPGKHTARVIALDAKTFKQSASPEVSFEVIE
jgi:hypothetical protein